MTMSVKHLFCSGTVPRVDWEIGSWSCGRGKFGGWQAAVRNVIPGCVDSDFQEQAP